MASQGPFFPGTTASLANAGTSENAEAWVNPGNIVSDNATEAQITAATYDSPDISQLLVASNFGFSIPAGSLIQGITVEIERRDFAGSASDNRVQLATGTTFATLVGDNKADLPTDWPGTATVKTYGSTSDSWGRSWTPTEVNAAGFAVMLSVQADSANTDIGVDFIRVTIEYVTPAGAKLFLRNAASDFQTGTNDARLNGSTSTWENKLASTSAGASATSLATATVTGATNGLEVLSSTDGVVWYSPPVDADVTISGAIYWHIYASESSASANVAINGVLDKVDGATGTITEIDRTARATEVALTTRALEYFTETPGAGVAVKRGDRLRIRVFGDDAGTMATGFTFSVSFDGPTADTDGDTYVWLTESVSFASEPAGTQMWLQNVAHPEVATADTDKVLGFVRGVGSNSDVADTVNGFTAPIRLKDTAATPECSWFSAPLAAFTLGGAVRVNAWYSIGTQANASARCEIAVVDNDGSNPVVWAVGTFNGEIPTTSTAQSFLISGDDLAVTDNQRIRVQMFIDDYNTDGAMATGQTVSMSHSTSVAGGQGDTWVMFSVTVTEFVVRIPYFSSYPQLLAH